jgi:MraZ protein
VEKCITTYTPSEWKKLADSLTTGSVTRSKLRRLNRATFGTAFRLEIDGQGRIALPVTLRQHAGIEDEAIIVGVNTSFELWNRELWEEEKATSREQVWQIIESLEQH